MKKWLTLTLSTLSTLNSNITLSIPRNKVKYSSYGIDKGDKSEIEIKLTRYANDKVQKRLNDKNWRVVKSPQSWQNDQHDKGWNT